jgi:hypothetical protein
MKVCSSIHTPQWIQPRIEGAAMKAAQAAKSPRVLVIDVGGTNVKMLATGQKEPRKYPSGPTMTPRRMVRLVKKSVRDWKFDCVSLGFPGPVINQHPLREPHNLGGGWMGFNFRKAFGCPVRIINDAAMQALGSYKGGRMLFLGLGTGLGSAMVVDGMLQPMELAHLIYKNGPIKRNVKRYFSPSAQCRHFFCLGIQPNRLNVHSRSGEWSCSDDVVSCFVSSHETVRSLFLPVVPFHCRDGAHSFLETDKRNDCRVANHGPI